MKESWVYKKLGDVCAVLNGFAFKSGKYADSGTRVIRITNVQKGFIVDDDPKFYPSREMQALNQYQLRENDLLMSLTGNVGRVGLLQKELLPAALNQRVACLRIKDNTLSLKFLFHWLNSTVFEQDAIFSASGIAQKNLSTEWLKSYKIGIPPISEQLHIIEELDLLSSIIEKKQAQLNELDSLVQSFFYEMFGDPIINDKEWGKKPFGEIASFKNGLNYHPSDNGFLIRCIGVGDFQDRKELRTFESIKELSINESIDESYFLTDGDIIIVRSNGSKELVGRNMIVFPKEEKITYSGFCIRCRLNTNELTPLVLNRILSCKSTMRVLRQEGRGCNISNINQKILSSLPIILPPINLQNQFAERVIAIEHQKELIKKSIKEVETLFNSRMDYYFN